MKRIYEIFVLVFWAFIGLLAVVSMTTVQASREPAAPEIQSVQPIGPDGQPHLRPGKRVTLMGKNFSPTLAKNRVGIRIVADNPQTPPQLCEYMGEVHLTSASADKLEGVMPLTLNDGYYLLWVRVQDGGHSKPFRVWLSNHPAPPPAVVAIKR